MLKGGLAATVAGALFLGAGFWVGFTMSRSERNLGTATSSRLTPPPATPRHAGRPHPSFAGLQQTVEQLLNAGGASGGVSLIELGSPGPKSWSYQGDEQFVAASTYKLPLLMEDAQSVSSGHTRGTQLLCYQDSDWEDGYFIDYQDGTCMSRAQLEQRVGRESDNTAAHILVRYNGGGDALNSYARAHGAQDSAFYVPNSTTSSDLARLWANEAQGHAGGKRAQQYLYPMLTRTAFEQGIPAGVPRGTTVVHKIGILGGAVNDAALVQGGPSGAYILTICTMGQGGDAGWALLADISRAVWEFEATR